MNQTSATYPNGKPIGLSLRRHELLRAKKKTQKLAKLVIKSWGGLEVPETLKENRELFARKHYRNRKKCSCHMCRNPRRSNYYKGLGKLSWSERKNQARWKDELEPPTNATYQP